MDLTIKVKGITRRWFVNVLAVVVGIVIGAEVLLAIFISSYYVDSFKQVANTYVKQFEALAFCDLTDFRNQARDFAELFEDKDKLEVQILNSAGSIIVTTTGFAPTTDEVPEYQTALKSINNTATWQGKTQRGEAVLACTIILNDYGDGSNGAIRWVVSMEDLNKQILLSILLVLLLGVLVIIISVISGVYFIRSIVHPLQEVSNVARKIALGDLDTRLEVKDNDEIGELCDTINYMASELNHAETIKNDFIASVSHELRTPLTAIRGWGETAKMSVGNDDEIVGRGLDVILGEADRLSGLVEELLDFSRMQSGKLTVNSAPLDIVRVARESYYMYVEVAKQQGISFIFKEPNVDNCIIVGDRNRLKQVFINVIDNAIKYTESGGNVEITAVAEEGCVRITVEDTGLGIPAQDIAHVKEKFFKSNKTVRGSGIGLAVADEIIKQHNGLLLVESQEGVGTTITMVLPIVNEQISDKNVDKNT